MKPKFLSLKIILLTFCSGVLLPASAQNVPDLTTTAPTGNATAITPPPPVSVNNAQLFNYMRSFVPKVPIDDPNTLTTVSGPATVQVSTVYKDGFNRDMQAVQHNFTPGKSLVMPVDTRFQQDQYSFLPYSTPGFLFREDAFTEQRNYYNNLYPGEGGISYSYTHNSSTSAQRSDINYAPGKSQAGQGRGTERVRVSNTANQVRKWSLNVSTGLPESSGYYDAGQLFVEVTTAPDFSPIDAQLNPLTRTYKDKEGNIIMQQLSDSFYTITNPGLTAQYTFATTLYIYDRMGRLRYTIPPKAAELAVSGTISQIVLDELCFQYRYDEKGRKVEQKMPGKGVEYYVYDKRDRVVFYQDSLMRFQHKWAFSFYDALNRPTITGFGEWNVSREVFVGYMEGNSTFPSNHWLYYAKNYDLMNAYPDTLPYCDILTYTYYDDYHLTDPNDALWGTYNSILQFTTELQSVTGSLTPVRNDRTKGMATGTKVRILPSASADASKLGDWRSTVIYYDDKGRAIYTVSRDLYQGNVIHASYSGSQYSFSGQLLASKKVQDNYKTVDVDKRHVELIKNQYADGGTGRLLSTSHKMDTYPWAILASYTYDDLGRVSRKSLGNNGEVQDFSYTIRGQVSGINALYAETANKQGLSRSFGESIKYDYGFVNPRYDGKIAGMVWRGSNRTNAYGYSYDLSGRLKQAEFRTAGLSYVGYVVTDWTKQNLDYTVSNLYYDKNGNIKGMKQRGVKPGTGPVDMDILGYTYKNSDQSNQLDAVSDGGVTDYGAGDFKDGHTGAGDYTYDGNGNLSTDANKGISSVQYNPFNKPVKVNMSGGRSLEYSYDAAGNKLQEMMIDPAMPVKKTDYLGNFVYRNDSLQYALTSEGRTAFNPQSANPVKEEYFVKDHLGNVRSTVDVVTYATNKYLATYEIASANLEGLLFDKVAEIRDDKPGSTDPGDTKAGRLNGGEPGRQIGTSLLVKVMAGDRVDMNVNNFYEGYDDRQDHPVNREDMLAALVSTLTGGAGGLGGSESHDTKMVDRLFTPGNYAALDNLINEQNTDPSRPKAYLNYVLFDETMKIVPEMSGAYQANSNGSWEAIGSQGARIIPANGYLAVYLTNRSNLVATCLSCSNVFFDKLNVEISKGNLLEENHYYPHGLPIVGLGSTADGFKENRRKYQSNEYIKDLNLNWMDFNARQYDPQIGRFLNIDPLADDKGQQVWSPYAAMGNAPESTIDPNGTVATTDRLRSMFILDPLGAAGAFLTIRNFLGGNWKDQQVKLNEHAKFSEAQINAIVYAVLGIVMQTTGTKPIIIQGGFACNFGGGGGGGDGSNNPVTLLNYSPYYGVDHRNGMNLRLIYKMDVSSYPKTGWIQNIITSRPNEGQPREQPYNDYDRSQSDANPPFYHSKSDEFTVKQQDHNFEGKYFADMPGRYENDKNYYWMGELSLVGLKQGKWQNIYTFRYGFINFEGIIIPLPFMPIKFTTPYQQSLIDSAKK
nr:RHS repeat-associated core domain-containing protein [Pedobacter sp. ASV19]